MRYIYYVIIVALLVTLVIFIKKASVLANRLVLFSNRANNTMENLNTHFSKKEENDDEEENKALYSKFGIAAILALFSIIQDINKDYKKSKKRKKSILKSTGKALIKNAGKIRRIRPI